ncbi:mitochondrial potassium channel ATP-binding subunit-like [Artemia franciscana]|uniref:Mitochondrial potassium channel ATP-binding subunit n=1 Tax=Artemia franciscana TaxID=6661 RepID=A0AA88HG76_ARTSF|nr:hypothetical protein QYM36_012563 [Artemia franciscana]
MLLCRVGYLRNATSHFLCIIRKPSIKLVTGGSAALFAGCQVINWKKARCEALKVTTRFDVGSKLVAVQPEFSWRKLFEYLKPQLWQLIGAIVSAFIVAILNIEIPRLLGNVVDVVSQFSLGRQEARELGEIIVSYLDAIRQPATKLCLYYLAQSFFTFSYITCLSQVGERMAANLRSDLFASLITQDIAFFDEKRTGELVNRITSDVQDFKSSFKICISHGLRSVTQVVGCFISLYSISPSMTGYMALIVPIIMSVGSAIGSYLRHLSRKSQAQVARATNIGEEALSNIRTVRAFAMEDPEIKLYEEEIDKARHLNEILGVGIGLFQAGTNLFLNSFILGTVYLGGQLMATNSMSAGDLMAFLVATQTLQRSMAQVSLVFGNYIRFTSSGARVFEYLNLRPSIRICGGVSIPFHSLFGNIEFDNVVFSYPTRKEQNALDNFSLKIPAGKVVALVGPSGGGKSTVAALLERFYDVDNGCIVIDGHMIEHLDPSWLRRKAIGFINQEPALFATSVLENIRYGRPEASDQEVIEAAKLANAHEFITTFPQGYETVVGERGIAVSGGQKQRIAIARALLKNPPILVLDEATSALDSESERQVQEALDTAIKGRTVIVIAHRLSSIRNADLIAVLNQGTITEVGSHAQLMKKKGMYYRLVTEQSERK